MIRNRNIMALTTVGISLLLTLHARTEEAWKLRPEHRLRSLEILREGLQSDDFWPAMHAAEALTLAGFGDEVVEVLQPALENEKDDQRRCGLARELFRAGDLDSGKILKAILEKADSHGHVHAAESLYKVGWQGSDRPLHNAFRKTGDLRLKLMAAAALGKFGEDEDQSESMEFLRISLRTHPDPGIFRLAAWVLGRIGSADDRTLIRSRLTDAEDPLARAFLEHSLAALGDPRGKTALLSNLTSDDAAIRTYAAIFAGELGMLEAVPSLILQLDDTNPDAAIRAAQSLLQLAR